MPKPEIPDGLYVSISQIKAYCLCPRRYELKYVRGEPPAFLPVALAFGTAIHSALAAYYSELKASGQPLRRDLVLDVFRDAWDQARSGPVPLQGSSDEDGEPGNVGDLEEKGISMLHAFYENSAQRLEGITVEAVEKSFAIELADPQTGDIMEEKLIGTVDLLVHDTSIGRRVVVEHKTASKKYGVDQLRYDTQPTAYLIGARQSGWGEVALRYQVLTKTKNPQVQIADVDRDEDDERDFLDTVRGVLRAIDCGAFWPVRGWQCRSCQYAHACTGAS